MIWEGMVQEGLAMARAIHDRYHPSRRNPWNEVECGDHYARSMASYGVFLAACGYEYHGPKRPSGVCPAVVGRELPRRLHNGRRLGDLLAEGRRRAAEGRVAVRWGKLALKTLGLLPIAGTKPTEAAVTLGGKPVEARLTTADGRATVEFHER